MPHLKDDKYVDEFRSYAYECFNQNKFTNIKIICDSKIFHAHAFIIGIQSDFFHKLLYNHFDRNEEIVIHLPDWEIDVVKIGLQYIYSGKVQNDEIFRKSKDLFRLNKPKITIPSLRKVKKEEANGSPHFLNDKNRSVLDTNEDTGQEAGAFSNQSHKSVFSNSKLMRHKNNTLKPYFTKTKNKSKEQQSNLLGGPSKIKPLTAYELIKLHNPKNAETFNLNYKVKYSKMCTDDEKCMELNDDENDAQFVEKINKKKSSDDENENIECNIPSELIDDVKNPDISLISAINDISNTKISSISSNPDSDQENDNHDDHDDDDSISKNSIGKTPDKDFLCTECNQVFNKINDLKEHRFNSKCFKKENLFSKDGKAIFKCKFCGKILMSFNSLIKHEQNLHIDHAEGKMCEICGKVNYGLKIFSHKRVHEDSQLVCHCCNRKFKHKSGLSTHMNHYGPNHRAEESHFECEDCDEVFKTLGARRLHRSSNHLENMFNCDKCTKSYKSKSLLKKHIQYIHSGIEQQIKCELCGINLMSKDSLRSHKLLFHDKGIYSCSECSITCSLRIELRKHIKTSHSQKIHKCPHCTSMFKEQKILQAHIITSHTDDSLKPCKCHLCPKGFISKYKLNRHLKSHEKGNIK